MIRRGPALPSRRLFGMIAGMVLGGVAVASMLVALERQAVPPILAVALPLGTSLAALALLLGVLEALKNLESSGWRAGAPQLRNWILYLGAFGLAGLAVGGLRSGMMILTQGDAASPWHVYVELGLCTYGTLLVAVLTDLQTRNERQALAKQAESLVAMHQLFDSREAWIQSRNRRREALRRIVTERVEPELAAVHAALAATGKPELSADMLANLCDRLDRLRDDEIRQLSHLTHPSIIDVGLQSALRGLARRYRDRLSVTLEADPALMESLSGTIRLTIYRVVELLLELAAPAVAESVIVRLARDGSELMLDVTGGKGTFKLSQAQQEGRLAVLEARVAMLGGAWRRLEEEGAEIGIHLRLPETP